MASKSWDKKRNKIDHCAVVMEECLWPWSLQLGFFHCQNIRIWSDGLIAILWPFMKSFQNRFNFQKNRSQREGRRKEHNKGQCQDDVQPIKNPASAGLTSDNQELWWSVNVSNSGYFSFNLWAQMLTEEYNCHTQRNSIQILLYTQFWPGYNSLLVCSTEFKVF